MALAVAASPETWDHVPVYGLDIETDTTVSGLDPAASPIVAVAVSMADGERVFDGDEASLLHELNRFLTSLPAGVIATWNGAGFDLPFLVDRAAVAGVSIGLRLTLDERYGRRNPLPGHIGAYRAHWGAHRHLDVYRVYRSDVRQALGISCGLKSIAALVGLPIVEVDASRIHELDREVIAEYVASDARLARDLALVRWATASRAVDVTPTTGSQ